MAGLQQDPALNTKFLLLLAAVASAAAPAYAAGIPMAAQPVVHTRDGTVQGCGARLTGGETAFSTGSAWFDVSFNVFRNGYALAQSYAYELRSSAAYDSDARPARVPVQSAWLKAPQGSPRVAENPERSDTLIWRLLLDDAVALFQALASGDTITVGIKRWDQPIASVYAGTPALTDEDRRALAECLARLTQ